MAHAISELQAFIMDKCSRGEVGELEVAITNAGVVDLDFTSDSGNSCLHWACDAGHANVCAVLIKYGATVNIQNSEGNTPLHLSAWRGHEDVILMLLGYGAQMRFKNFKGMTPIDMCRDPRIAELIISWGDDDSPNPSSIIDEDEGEYDEEDIGEDDLSD